VLLRFGKIPSRQGAPGRSVVLVGPEVNAKHQQQREQENRHE
jgi:hypothetical protein